jgi:hypothetical protein
MAYGAYIAAGYFIFLLVRERRARMRPVALAGIAAVLALLIAAPSVAPFIQFVRRTGYLEVRANAALQLSFPLRHVLSFIRPDRLGNPAYHNWNGDRALGILNNYIEATVYVGLVAIPLLLLGIFNRRARSRWFWLALLAFSLACMFGFMPFVRVVGELPGFKYSPLTRLQIVLPIAVAYLAAAGTSWMARRRLALLAPFLAVLAAADLGVFAGRFYPYLDTTLATPPPTPMTSFLQAQARPFRIAPLFIYLWPNASELYRLEDVRSHFSSEAKYRTLLQRIDPTSFSGNSTVITFNSLKFNFADPLVSMLGIRYFIENRDIDIIKWTTLKDTVPGVKQTGEGLILPPGGGLQRHVAIDAEPYYAVELSPHVEKITGRLPRMVVSLMRGPLLLYSRAFAPDDIAALEKIYIPVRGYARAGDTLLVRLQSFGMRVALIKGASAAGDAPLFYGRVKSPVVFDRQLPDGRLFRNLGEMPRFWAVRRLRRMSDALFLATPGIDFMEEAILTDDSGPLSGGAAEVILRSYADDEQRVEVRSSGATFLASSEKSTPELRITVDGREVKPVTINLLFAGVPVPAGTHQVVFSRRIGRGWWWLSAAALMAAVVLSVIDVLRR